MEENEVQRAPRLHVVSRLSCLGNEPQLSRTTLTTKTFLCCSCVCYRSCWHPRRAGGGRRRHERHMASDDRHRRTTYRARKNNTEKGGWEGAARSVTSSPPLKKKRFFNSWLAAPTQRCQEPELRFCLMFSTRSRKLDGAEGIRAVKFSRRFSTT